MLINKLKSTKPIDIGSILKEFIIKNYKKESLTEKLNSYFEKINKNRKIISQVTETQGDIDTITKNIKVLTEYINQLYMIKEKLSLDKEVNSLKIEFTWSETIKSSIHYTSTNIFFEIYNVMFNLATLYYNIGVEISKIAAEKNGHKQACNYFRIAMYLHNVLKEECQTRIPEKELPLDLFPAHLWYCKTICEIKGQLEIYKINKEMNSDKYALNAKLILAASELYNKARILAENPQTKEGANEEILEFLSNRELFYKAIMYKDLKENARHKFENIGNGYGEMILYQGLCVQTLLECQKNLKNCGKFVNIENF